MSHKISIGISTFISRRRKNDFLTIHRKRKFSEMAVKLKKAIKSENLPPTEGSAWQHSLKFIEKSHTGKYYTIQHLTRLNGAGNSQRIAYNQ